MTVLAFRGRISLTLPLTIAVLSALLWLTLAPISAAVAATISQTAHASGTGQSLTISNFTVPADLEYRYLVVGVSTRAGVTVQSVTFGSQPLIQTVSQTQNDARSEIWALVAPDVGTADITVHLSASAPVIAGAVLYGDVDQANPVVMTTWATQVSGGLTLLTNHNDTGDQCFSTISIQNGDNPSFVGPGGTADGVTATERYDETVGEYRGAGATRAPDTANAQPASCDISWGIGSLEFPQQTTPAAATMIIINAGGAAPADTTPPVIAAHDDVIAEATSASGANVAYTYPTATDDIVDPFSATCSPASGALFDFGETTVTCNASDLAGNAATATTFPVTVQDTTGPVIADKDDVTAEATSASGANVTYTSPATTDAVDGPGTASCTPVSGSLFAIGSTEVTCTATDSRNNAATSTTFDVIVQDTTAPTLTVPEDITEEATSASGATVTFDPIASDLVDANPSIDCDYTSGDTFPIGTTTVTCTASDDIPNTSEAQSFDITVEDTTAPTLNMPQDITQEATSPSGNSVTFSVTATDIVDTDPTIDCDYQSADTFPIGETTVTCSATDDYDNTSATQTFTITVQDTTPPNLTVSDDLTEEATGPTGANVPFIVSATDIADPDPEINCSHSSGDLFPLGQTTVTCTATDAYNNTSDAQSFDIWVLDTTAPTIGALPDLVVDATEPDGTNVTWTAIAMDIVDGELPVTCTPASGSFFLIGTTTVECSATDSQDNTASESFTVRVLG
ncbi:MAG: HYR domain-containing protein, partial [Solirubrobacterales bacterium]|nr:HYR domain-containing protein [Solirubrobacterales bacterium]